MLLRPDCSACGQACHVKDWRLLPVATPFGAVAVRLPRFRWAGCGHGETGIGWLAASFADRLGRRPRPGHKWHLDEVFSPSAMRMLQSGSSGDC
jgi:hypothetical protein